MTAPISDTGAPYVAPSPFTDDGFVPVSELRASANILIENSLKRTFTEGESGQPGEPEGTSPSKYGKLANEMLVKLKQWRKDRGLAGTVHAVAAATAAARDVPGDGEKWEILHGKSWDDDENNYQIHMSGANTMRGAPK